MKAETPRLEGVLETVLYFSDQKRTEAFYSGVLGCRLLDKEEGRSLFYRAGSSVLLLFDLARARKGGTLPPHGASGPIHVCFRVPTDAYELWKRHLEVEGVEIVQEVEWEQGLSLYFLDPHGNLLELANADIWPV